MQVRSEETRGRILKAASKLFAEKGFESTGVAEICTESDVSKGALYHHFPSKQAIFLELLQEWLSGIDRGLMLALADAPNVPEALMAMSAQMRNVFSAARDQLELFLEFWQQARRDPEVWKQLIEPYRRYRDYFAKIIQKGIDQGSIRHVDPQAAGQALVALAVGIVLQGVLDPGGGQWDLVTQNSLRLLLEGLGTRESGR